MVQQYHIYPALIWKSFLTVAARGRNKIRATRRNYAHNTYGCNKVYGASYLMYEQNERTCFYAMSPLKVITTGQYFIISLQLATEFDLLLSESKTFWGFFPYNTINHFMVFQKWQCQVNHCQSR